MEDNRIPIFTGTFLFVLSIFVVLIGMFSLQSIDENITRDHLEIIMGWIGALIVGGVMSLNIYSSAGGSYAGDGDSTDSLISFGAGLSIALYILMGMWLFLTDTPMIVIAFGLGGTGMAFVGMIMVAAYWGESSPY